MKHELFSCNSCHLIYTVVQGHCHADQTRHGLKKQWMSMCKPWDSVTSSGCVFPRSQYIPSSSFSSFSESLGMDFSRSSPSEMVHLFPEKVEKSIPKRWTYKSITMVHLFPLAMVFQTQKNSAPPRPEWWTWAPERWTSEKFISAAIAYSSSMG